jgi:hypothetical protein
LSCISKSIVHYPFNYGGKTLPRNPTNEGAKGIFPS